MDQFLLITRALSDPTRLRALAALRGGELCLCQLIELLELAPSTVSRHMSVLMQAGLVDRTKRGRWQHYRLRSPAPDGVAAALEWAFGALERDPQLRRDARALSRLRKLDPEELTGCYRPD